MAKDLAYLVLLGVLVLPLDPISGLTSGLAVLAVGHYRSVLKPLPQAHWRFTSGALFPDGIVQIAALFTVGWAVKTEGLTLISPCIVAWFTSLLFFGWQWDRRKLFP